LGIYFGPSDISHDSYIKQWVCSRLRRPGA